MKAFVTAVFLACSVPAPGQIMPWASIRNPVLQYQDRSVKDAVFVRDGGRYYFFFSSFHENGGRIRCHVTEVWTTDFKSFSQPVLDFSGMEDGWIGMASPDVFCDGKQWVLTFNSWGDHPDRPNQLFYRTSPDLVHWSPVRPLAANLTKNIRGIDVSVARASQGYFLIWKEVQTLRLAFGKTLDGAFSLVGDGYPKFDRFGTAAKWHENCQFIRLEGRWHLLTTSDGHKPYLYRMKGDGSRELDWLEWIDGRLLNVPAQGFNTFENANAASMWDGSGADGFYYLLYAGTTEQKSYLGRGWNRLGLARSSDLKSWEPAPQANRSDF